jgi:hypothetical protein
VAFVTVDEVGTRLGYPLTPEEQTRVQAFIDDCTVLIEDYCGRDFERRENQSFQLPSTGSCFLKIPRRYLPFLEVTEVKVGDQVVTDWVLNDLEVGLYREAGWGQVVTITGSWGYFTPPAVLKTATAAEVIRWMAQTPGLAMERTGEREVEYATASSPQSLSAAAMQALRRYRPSAGTITLKRGDC